MFGQFSSNIVRFFIRKRLLFLLLLGGIIAFLILGLNRLKIEEDLYSVFPDGKEYREFSQILQKNNLNKQIVFSVNVGEDEEQTLDQLDQIVIDLEKNFSSEIGDFIVYRSVDEKALISYLQSSSIIQFSAADYEKISQKLSVDSIEKALSKAAERLEGANGFFLRSIIAKDPLGLTNTKLSQLNPMSDSSSYLIKDGLVYTKDEKKILFFATLKIDLKNTDLLTKFNTKLSDHTDNVNEELGENTFDYFGTFQIAAENAIQVKKDTSTTTYISLGLILLLLVLYYRSILAPFYFILPAVFGMLCGGGLVGYLDPEISAISLATSSVLLGIVLDYSFHFFTHYKHSGDLLETIREISAPMIIGSFTTVAALAALMFTDSVVLQDFGLIALCVLSGSVIFTIYFLPVIIHILRIKIPETKEGRISTIVGKSFVRISIFLITIITLFFLFKGLNLSFDADLNNLSYHSDALKKKEEFFTGINPVKEKKLYLIASAPSVEDAKELNAKIYALAIANKEQFGISELVSTAPYLIPKERLENAQKTWKTYWFNKKDSVERLIKTAGKQYHFSDQAFTPFYAWMNDGSVNQALGNELSDDLGLSKFEYTDNGETTYITSIVLDRDHLSECKEAFRNIDGAYILDIADMTEKMLNSVQNDFNYLLLFSSLLVFISLLVVYGRIELALFAFFPMVLGWIWILGLSDLLDLKFNFVNIVIATFIFGLGDDFSIFATDGLIQRYKTGTDILKSYRSAIILSGITTIIGTGALYFAKHPAIHSIALISVVGISCILFITLYLQPLIFNFFVTNRVKKGKVPVTFFNLIYSTFLFTYFFVGSILLNIFLIFFILPFPASKTKKRAFLNYLVSKLAKSTLYIGVHVKKRVLHPERLDFSKPSIIVANHSSFLDILLVIMLHPKSIIMVKSWVYNSPVFGLFIRYAGYPFAEEGAETNLEFIKERIAEGYSIVVFPEGTRSVDGEIKRFHKGAFFIAKELGLDIQPILLIGAHEVNPKNDILISKSHLIVLPLDRISSPPEETYSQLTKRVTVLMRSAFLEGKRTHAKTDFWQSELLKNYVLKGPILEWYVRVKWMLEKKNFEYYDELIGERKRIYDLGCGYGYLSYYLHYRDLDRKITAVDYDAEKISVAANGMRKNNHLSFVSGDVRTFNFEPMDVIFLNDVLHYLPKPDQDALLLEIAEKLNDNGILFIRDGIKEMEAKFKKTKLTEFLSTKLFKFNKISNDLEFISEVDMAAFAAKNGFTMEKIEHSKTTSNVLLILRLTSLKHTTNLQQQQQPCG
jgi:1-acyl-sn-glycerol-3-phosphate acyltransferase